MNLLSLWQSLVPLLWLVGQTCVLVITLVMLYRGDFQRQPAGVLDFSPLLFLSSLALERLLALMKTLRHWQRSTLLESIQAAGGITATLVLVSLGFFILFFETCAPVWSQFSGPR